MARKARVQFPGAVYHLLDRGDRREAIFRDELDRRRFLSTLGETCGRTGWRVHAFVLLTNHYHLLVQTPQPNLVAGMRWLQSTWAIRFNRRHGLCGHLFQGRYKSIVVDPEERNYLVTLSDYIHLNPVRAGLVRLDGRLFDYPWSSYPLYAARTQRPVWFEPLRVLGELDLEDSAQGTRRYAERMRRRAVEELAQPGGSGHEELRRSWCLGSPSFRERVLGLLEGAGETFGTHGERDPDPPGRYDSTEAERIVRLGLAHYGLEQSQMQPLLKNDPRKQIIARLVRRRTAVDNRWIAQRLAMGHASAVSRSLQADPVLAAQEKELLEAITRSLPEDPTNEVWTVKIAFVLL